MLDRWNTAYLSGLTHMASSAAAGTGPSYIDAVFFGNPDPLAAFARYFRVSLRQEDLVPSDQPLETVLGQWLGDRDVTERLFHWIGFHIGQPGRVWVLPEDEKLTEALSRERGGLGAFYFMEDLCFAAFPDGLACFMMGNDE